jgi:hypothetical protein
MRVRPAQSTLRSLVARMALALALCAAIAGAQEEATPLQRIARSSFEVSGGEEAFGRQFKYSNGISRSPGIYGTFPALMVAVGGRVFPFASVGSPWGDIGLAGDYSLTLLQERDLRGASSSTVPTSYSPSVCVRIHPGSAARFLLLGASVGYAFTSFGRVGTPAAELPDATYRSVRPALDARLSLGPVSIYGVAAFRAIIDANAISARFYNPRGYGLDAEVGVALLFARRVEMRLSGRYERYSFAFTPPRGATFAGGSALDQLYGIRLSLAFVF